MFSKKQALKLIKLAVYQNLLFLIYSFIHQRFTTSNFYYFPLVCFVYYIFEFSLRKIIKGEKSESDGCWINLLLFVLKFFLCFCLLVYSMSDTTMYRPDTVLYNFLWLAVEIVFVTLISYPMFFIADSIKSKSESETFGKDSERNFINLKQLTVLIVVGQIELAIIFVYGKQVAIPSYLTQGILIPIFMLASRLLTYDLIVSKKLKDSFYKIAIIALINAIYTPISFGLTSFLIFANFQGLFDLNLMVLTVILYTIAEVILDYFRDPSKESEFIEKPTESDRLAMADADHKNSIIQNMTDTMVECINCNFSIKNPSTNLCPNCGSDIYLKSEYISCESCGSDYDHSADSCLYCGHIPSH